MQLFCGGNPSHILRTLSSTNEPFKTNGFKLAQCTPYLALENGFNGFGDNGTDAEQAWRKFNRRKTLPHKRIHSVKEE